jgi:hypothetical protein
MIRPGLHDLAAMTSCSSSHRKFGYSSKKNHTPALLHSLLLSLSNDHVLNREVLRNAIHRFRQPAALEIDDLLQSLLERAVGPTIV